MFMEYGFAVYAAFLAAAVFLKYAVAAGLSEAFGWKFGDGPIKGNILGTCIVTFVLGATLALAVYSGAFGDSFLRERSAAYVLMTLAAVAASTFSAFWIYSDEMDALREADIKKWLVKLVGGAFISLISFFVSLIIFAMATLCVAGFGGVI